jgi:hypothetical protein
MRIAAALLAGLAVLVLLFPVSGILPVPPECYSVFGYTVPCELWVAIVAGAATALVTGVLLGAAIREKPNG